MLKGATLAHPIGKGPLAKIFNIGPFPWGGDATTLNMTINDPTDPTARPLVCATVTGRDTAELRARRDAVEGADLVEVRIDSACDPDDLAALTAEVLPDEDWTVPEGHPGQQPS